MKLFVYPLCPYCHNVQRVLKELGLVVGKDYELVDGHDNSAQLIQLGGKQQVPFLVDGDTMMYESDDIIAYLKKKFLTVD